MPASNLGPGAPMGVNDTVKLRCAGGGGCKTSLKTHQTRGEPEDQTDLAADVKSVAMAVGDFGEAVHGQNTCPKPCEGARPWRQGLLAGHPGIIITSSFCSGNALLVKALGRPWGLERLGEAPGIIITSSFCSDTCTPGGKPF